MSRITDFFNTSFAAIITGASTIFNGVNQYITFGDSNVFSFGDGVSDSAFSLSVWVYHTDSLRKDIINKEFSSSSIEYALWKATNNKINIALYDGASSTNVRKFTNNAITLNAWNHIAVTYDGRGGSNAHDGIKIYINSVDNATTKSSAGSYNSMHNTTAQLKLSRLERVSFYASQNLSNPSIMDKELSPSEVNEIYNGGLPTNLTSASFSANVVFSARLDASDDLTTSGGVTDYIGVNNGTAINMTAANTDSTNFPT